MSCIITIYIAMVMAPFAPIALPLAGNAVANNCAEPICQQLNR